MKIATYLRMKGRCNEALDLYKDIFNGEELFRYVHDENTTENESMIGKIFHAEMKIQDFYIYMSDTQEDLDYNKQAYNITVEVDTLEEAHRIFDRLKEGGRVHTPITKMAYGPYIGNLFDKFGINWDIVYC
ncbi:VOC family protein [Vallitalea okinawensis]|uniref:VOC family protein n=1 Tax=Vallitalea okinawensis TaxID=2078660 RepID=UPI000CFBAD2F|nr:VOC family protein [Vallitalea okinawensis]